MNPTFTATSIAWMMSWYLTGDAVVDSAAISRSVRSAKNAEALCSLSVVSNRSQSC